MPLSMAVLLFASSVMPGVGKLECVDIQAAREQCRHIAEYSGKSI